MEGLRSICINKPSDGELVAAAECGNTQAFEQLVFRYERRVLAVAQRIANNGEDAADVMQEGFHKAFDNLRVFQEKSRFSPWLTRIAVNDAFMVLRLKRRNLDLSQESPDDELESVTAKFVDQRSSPEAILLAPGAGKGESRLRVWNVCCRSQRNTVLLERCAVRFAREIDVLP
jgi:RNA polymerase sigma factor (sigma-70 family)